MDKFRIGTHFRVKRGLLLAPHYARNIGCTIFQIFLGPPDSAIVKTRPIDELIKFGEELEKYDVVVVIHGNYTINLAQPHDSARYRTSMKSLIKDLDATSYIGDRCLGVIIHMGKNISENNLTYQQGMDNYIQGLKNALHTSPKNTVIILETGASTGSEVGSKLDDLAEIYWKLDANERKRLKFCIDTCHIWATGYAIDTPKGVRDFFKEFNDKIGIKKIACIHFNDSKAPRDSKVDRHADLGYGFIGTSGLKEVAKLAFKYKIPLITETPLDAINPKTKKQVTFKEEIDKIKSWAG